MSQKRVELKPKITVSNDSKASKPATDEVVVTINDRPAIFKPMISQTQQGTSVPIFVANVNTTTNKPLTAQPPRVFVPEKNEPVNTANEDDEEEYEEGEEEDEDNEEEDNEAAEEEDDNETTSLGASVVDENGLSQQVSKRKPRTKKVYPPSDDMFEQLIKSMCELRETTRKVITLARETQKCVNREGRDLRNQVKKQKGDKPKRKPRGFALPSPISTEMLNYLLNVAKITHVDRKINNEVVGQIKLEPGCSLARNELTSALCEHFRLSGMRKNDLDHRKIYLDATTTKLFGIDPKKFAEAGGLISESGEPIITYFDLQKYLPRHCGKNALGH